MRNSAYHRLSLAALIVSQTVSFPILAEAQANTPTENSKHVVRFDGKTFEQALTEFQSELSPATRIKSLQILIQFAIRDHHASEVAELLVNEGRILPLNALIEVDPRNSEGMLHQVMSDFDAYTADADLDAEVERKLNDEIRYWSKVCEGIYRLALPQRKVFEQAMENPEHPISVRILARIAVQHADLRTVKIQAFLESIPLKSETAQAEFRRGDLVTIVLPAQGKDHQTGREFEAVADIHTHVMDVLEDQTLCLEYRNTSQTDQGATTIHVTGRVRAKDVDAERKVHAEKVSELIVNQQHKKPVCFSVQNLLEQIYHHLP